MSAGFELENKRAKVARSVGPTRTNCILISAKEYIRW